MIERLGPGDRVALTLPGSRKYVDVIVSLLVRGIVPIPLDPKLTAVERSGILADLEPARVVARHEDLLDLDLGWEPGQIPLARPMHVTSGTTGRPKGVWSGVLEPDDARALFAEEVDLWQFSDSDL
ncbi:MAG TPA: AMP-dependent synthetase, partial [Marmoricola sp.]|nr:AMP-dependent synthetase [Marmoricola sp.]